jgi:hypothetical protein
MEFGVTGSLNRRTAAVHLPPPGQGTSAACASPTSSGRSSPARSTCSAALRDDGLARQRRGPQALFEANDYTELPLPARLGVETAEALAEFWHKRMRQELGIAGDDSPKIKDLFTQHYRGSRYSFGYPACPDMSDQDKLFQTPRPRAHRLRAHRELADRPRAVDQRDHRAPPRGEVLQRVVVTVIARDCAFGPLANCPNISNVT